MFTRHTMSSAVMVLICSLILQPCAHAQPGNRFPGGAQQEQQEEQQDPQTRIDRREASEIARKAYGGRVLNIRLVRGEWRVRLDNEGTVFDVYVDADTGRTRKP